MNSYTFVAKKNNNQQPQQEMRAGPSILQRLQQLKQSMRPVDLCQHQYESAATNKNLPNLNLSNIQNQRLNKYLPHDNQPKNTEQGQQQFESYRRSLQKKLSYLFEKQKQIMKTQSTYHQSQKYDLDRFANDKFQQQAMGKHQINPTELERKYRDFKQLQQHQIENKNNMRTLIERQTRSSSNINNYQYPPYHSISTKNDLQYNQRQHKAFSTIQHFAKYPHTKQRKDEEIEQMQRKIKILEMKYLGGNMSMMESVQNNNRLQLLQKQQRKMINHAIEQNDDDINNKNSRQYRSKSAKSKSKKQRTSPDNAKTRTKNTQKQTIQNSYPSQKKQSKLQTKQKQKIKDYMTQVANNNKSEYESQHVQQQQMLYRQFNALKLQFQALLEINKSVIEKVELSSQERAKKKQNKRRAKAMLKEILYRLDEIKTQIRGRSKLQNQLITQNEINQGSKKKQAKDNEKANTTKKLIVFQKSIGWNCPKETSKEVLEQKSQFSKTKNPSPKISLCKDHKKYEQNFEDIEKLKQLLDLQIQHRSIVEKKFQVIYGQKGTIQ